MAPLWDQVYTYAPGSVPMQFPNDSINKFGIEIPANSNIATMHYPEGSFGQLDSTKVRFYFYPQNTSIRPIYTEYLINEGCLQILHFCYHLIKSLKYLQLLVLL